MIKANRNLLKHTRWMATCLLLQAGVALPAAAQTIAPVSRQYEVPVLKENDATALERVAVNIPADGKAAWLQQVQLSFTGTTQLNQLTGVRVYSANGDTTYLTPEKTTTAALFARYTATPAANTLTLTGNLRLNKGTNYLWVALSVKPTIPLLHKVAVQVSGLQINGQRVSLPTAAPVTHRVGTAVRKGMQDNVHTSRIPGIATANNGDLLAIYDARYELGRDLQGDIDIALNRSTDKGATWQPLQVVLDKGTWGNLPEKFNGVSDPCIVVDKKTGTIYIAGLWMYGVLDPETGKWIDDLTDTSKIWNHQWRSKGSQPGFDPKQTSQFLLTKSTDNGKTWSEPVNLTAMCKRPEWWLWAPAPGSGIVLTDGTLVLPTQGRDETGKPFSNITYSKDGGKTWATSNPAVEGQTTECMAVQLNDGSVMLNMRTNANKGLTGAGNGRTVSVTKDLGKTWIEHPTSRKALPEPVCMASIFKHNYTRAGKQESVLLFLNPHSTTQRNRITLQASFDDGKTWPAAHHILLDELNGRGYSCITSVDNNTIGLLYESSQAHLVFQQVSMQEIIEQKNK
ncbi:sialidase family protein [Paraflavitalea pollutisoli]|uniref:sialidase family protein n=1 Tax=Paraflavitalea pollutisoli TaxID=3034143 RepID=UPI0023EADAF4|nr:sialidase family protein [Paraflavitalea sp. H1-2-19X]